MNTASEFRQQLLQEGQLSEEVWDDFLTRCRLRLSSGEVVLDNDWCVQSAQTSGLDFSMFLSIFRARATEEGFITRTTYEDVGDLERLWTLTVRWL